MPADTNAEITRRSFLGISEDECGHVSSLLVRARPDQLAALGRRIAALSVAEISLSDPSGKIIVTLETRDEDEVVAAMDAIQGMAGVVSVALVFHQTEA
jgi:nitrate reductase NapAB chaperone NapD